VLGRARRRVIVIDAGRPRNAPAAHMHGFLSRDGMPPGELLAAGRAEVRRYGVALVTERVVDALPGTVLHLSGGRRVEARHVLLATGAADVLPDEIEGARARWGRDLLHCPYCHGWEVRDRPVGVLASAEHAQLLRQWTDDVTLLTHAAGSAPAVDGVTVVDGIVARLVVDEDDRLRGAQLADGREVAFEALFIRPQLRPNADNPAVLLGCALRDDGLVHSDEEGRTSVPGVWAAGNATNPRAQVITAAGEGSAVAIAINTALVHADVPAVR